MLSSRCLPLPLQRASMFPSVNKTPTRSWQIILTNRSKPFTMKQLYSQYAHDVYLQSTKIMFPWWFLLLLLSLLVAAFQTGTFWPTHVGRCHPCEYFNISIRENVKHMQGYGACTLIMRLTNESKSIQCFLGCGQESIEVSEGRSPEFEWRMNSESTLENAHNKSMTEDD